MYTAISRGTLVGVALLSIACGRSMPVEYNPIMQLSDFEDAVYGLKQ